MGNENAFCIRLAGRVIRIFPLYPWLRVYCCQYLVDSATPDVTLSVCPEDIAFERDKSQREDEAQGRAPRQFPDEYLETLAAYRKIAVALLDYDTLLVHGSCVAVDGEGYLFAAPSGTGKSTHTRLWMELFRDRAVMVNDDKPLIQVTQEGAIAYGTPWDGKHRRSTNTAVPLKAICFLDRAECNRIEQIDFWTGYPLLLRQSYRPDDEQAMRKTLALTEQLGEAVGMYALGCNMEPEAAQVAYSGMKGAQ
ncbi:MAG: hypothetical protein LUE89_05390 [Clostridiales bacterium]|nr:hypothetical protein [Clostridiales bacterium]